ncbi:MAG TPA: adenylosuccinate lyase [Armatimonadota bacterium]|nr:adenylosuccinate lyase [Armatimonadota bacterium]
MIDRYSLPKMKAIWEQENRFQKWLDVEIAVAEGLSEYGYIPKDAPAKIKVGAKFTVERVLEIEETTQHDVMAFVKAVTENLGEEGKYVHYGITSYDVVDTALGLLMRESADLIIADLERLAEVVRGRAREHKHTLMIGRTHGIHAEPITFGFKLAGWYAQILRDIERTKSARKAVGVGKVSGAVGIYANIDPRIERYVCDKLGLEPAEHSTQIVARDRHAQFLTALAIIAGSLESFATELRNLQRTEILEAQEYFAKGQKGSSAMPHKRNPRLSEQVAGLARVVRSNAFPALENIVTWHERDLTNSSVERIIIPDSCILVDYLLNTFAKVVERLIIYPENMMRNLELMGGLVFSERVMLRLVEKGLSREDAYTVVQENAAKAWEGQSFRAALESDPRVTSALSKEELAEIFDYKRHIRNVDAIFERLGI